ncbi:MAG TPA: hypothetical protein PKY82_31940, partial [Pyrinomonadaceae bacterium]|nr:hypothetical protein [Pyrinomonadaceae bacterium]
MEILDAGAFINLENQEKIEQLKYTAVELAKAALESDGFVNQEEPARKLALEFWQGLEYMCRETESTAIQNIFVGQFLEHLRALRLAVVITENPSLGETVENNLNPAHQPILGQDEFLGVLSAENQISELNETGEEDQLIPVFADNSSSSIEVVAENNSTEDRQIEVSLPLELQSEPDQSSENPNQNIEFSNDEEEIESEDLETEEFETEEVESSEVKSEEIKSTVMEATGNLTLAEKEPYQFHKCTVTATIQLLPVTENSDVRRVVLSIRTHDFAPNISLVEVSSANLTTALVPELEKVLARYQAELPLKVIDKMKKEKTSRQKTKPVSETKTTNLPTTNPKQISAPLAKVIETSPTGTPTPPTPDSGSGAQGTL